MHLASIKGIPICPFSFMYAYKHDEKHGARERPVLTIRIFWYALANVEHCNYTHSSE